MKTATIEKQAKQLRHELHAIPELGFKETATRELLVQYLKSLGITDAQLSTTFASTGICVKLEGKRPLPSHWSRPLTVGIRADMDALPMQELGQPAHKSKTKGCMHACGHDGHMAILYGALAQLMRERDFAGNIVFIFQPAEEGLGGAKVMLEEGFLKKFPLDYIFALHNWPDLPIGQVAVRSGPMMANTDTFNITVTGKGGHAAFPQQTTDPVIIGSHLVSQIQTIAARNSAPTQPVVVSVTQFHAGTGHNVIPETASLSGTVRTLTQEYRELVIERLGEICNGIAQAHGAKINLEFNPGYPATVNHHQASVFAAKVAQQVPGVTKVHRDLPPSLGGEDFSYFLQEVKGCYLWLGSGKEDEPVPGLHSPYYDFNDGALNIGIQIWAALANQLEELLCFD